MNDGLGAAAVVEGILAGHMKTQALLLGHRLGIFRMLADGPRSPASLAEEAGYVDTVVLTKLLQTLGGLGLLECRDEEYVNSADAQQALVPDSPYYYGDFLDFFSSQYAQKDVQAIGDRIQHATPVTEQATPDDWNTYLRAMTCMAGMSADTVSRAVDLKHANRLMDLGGGSGHYSVAFCKTWPQLYVTIYDLPASLQFAESVVQQNGLSDRIELISGSATRHIVRRTLRCNLRFAHDPPVPAADGATNDRPLRRITRAGRHVDHPRHHHGPNAVSAVNGSVDWLEHVDRRGRVFR